MAWRWVYRAKLLARSLLRRSAVERELEEEMRFHVEAQTRYELATGRSVDEARRSVRGVEQHKEECRDMRGLNWLEELRRDIRYGVRTLARSPGFTLAAAAALALGIGANTAVFSVVNAVLLRPLPFAEPERIVWIQDALTQTSRERFGSCMADFLLWQSRSRSFEPLAGWSTNVSNLTGAGEAERVPGLVVTARFFDVLRARPLVGRTFTDGEDRPGGPLVALISEQLWERRFGRKPEIVGRSIELNGRQVAVIGVMPASFRFANRPEDIWMILALDPPTRRGPFFMRGLARLRPGVSLEQANREMEALGAEVERADPKERVRYPVTTLMAELTGDVWPLLTVISGAVGLVLLIAVFNVANLMLARATVRQREIAIRSSLGAGRGQLARQLMTECVLLSLFGGLAGVALAAGGVSLLRSLAPPGLPRLEEIAVDGRVLWFTLAVSVASGLAFGLAPAFGMGRTSPAARLKEGGRNTNTRGGGRLRSALVIGEVALSIVLLAGAGLLIRSFAMLGRVQTGFHSAADRLLMLQLSPTGPNYRERPKLGVYWTQLLERVRAVPGVESAAITISAPPDRTAFSDGFEIQGRTGKDGGPIVPVPWVSRDYFRTFGIPVLRGRVFDERDRLDTPGVMVISETLARRYFPGEDPVGKRMKHGGPTLNNPYQEIIGVVADVKYGGLAAEDVPVYYESADQNPSRPMWLAVRTNGAARQWLPAVQAEIHAIDRNVPIARAGSMEEALAESIAVPRFRSTLMAVFAIAALGLAAVGIYGVLAYSIEQRTQEIGVRMALGATPPEVLRLVMGQGSRLAGAGIVLGSAGGLALTRVLKTMLFGVEPSDAMAFAGAALALGVVAGAAMLIPALRATRVDPVRALRGE